MRFQFILWRPALTRLGIQRFSVLARLRAYGSSGIWDKPLNIFGNFSLDMLRSMG